MITNLAALREKLIAINAEISVATPFQAAGFQAGLVAFQPRQGDDDKSITHTDAEVITYVLEGRGRLRLPDGATSLWPGTICYIPLNTRHDFVAEGDAPLLMFYVTVKVQAEPNTKTQTPLT